MQARVTAVGDAQIVIVAQGLQDTDLTIIKLQHQRHLPLHEGGCGEVDNHTVKPRLTRHQPHHLLDGLAFGPLHGEAHALCGTLQPIVPGNEQDRVQPHFIIQRSGVIRCRFSGLFGGLRVGLKHHGIVHGRISTPWIELLSRWKAVRNPPVL